MITEQVTLDIQLHIGPARQKDLEVIHDILIEREMKRATEAGTVPDLDAALTLDNARAVLAIGLRNKPAAWTITPAELVEMWAELVGEAEAG